LFAHAAWCGQNGDAAVVGHPPDPGPIGLGALFEHGRLEAFDADDVVEEVDQVLGSLHPLEVAGQDDAIPTGVDELDSATKQLWQSIHGSLLRWG
jgi:hypothetical protein